MSDAHGDTSFQAPPGAICLAEKSRTYLLDGIVYRPRAPWTPTVHALLGHLESVGYRGSSRLVEGGIDAAGRQQLRYIDGELVHPYAWSDPGIIEVARLLRELHDATASFVPPQGAVWSPWYSHRPRADPVFGHGDTGPWNIVARDGLPVAFIDQPSPPSSPGRTRWCGEWHGRSATPAGSSTTRTSSLAPSETSEPEPTMRSRSLPSSPHVSGGGRTSGEAHSTE